MEVIRRSMMTVSVIVVCCGNLVSQQGSVVSGPASVKEFPVNLKQNSTAGGTPVGGESAGEADCRYFRGWDCVSEEYGFFWTGY